MILVTFRKTGKVSVRQYKNFKDYLKKTKWERFLEKWKKNLRKKGF